MKCKPNKIKWVNPKASLYSLQEDTDSISLVCGGDKDIFLRLCLVSICGSMGSGRDVSACESPSWQNCPCPTGPSIQSTASGIRNEPL
jgi:hypothetical protein